MLTASLVAGLLLAGNISFASATKLSHARISRNERRFNHCDNNGALPNTHSIGTGPEKAFEMKRDNRSVFRRERRKGRRGSRGRGSQGRGSQGRGSRPTDLKRRQSAALGLVKPICTCTSCNVNVKDDELEIKDIRELSDLYASDGNAPTDVGASNMVWAWVCHSRSIDSLLTLQFGLCEMPSSNTCRASSWIMILLPHSMTTRGRSSIFQSQTTVKLQQ